MTDEAMAELVQQIANLELERAMLFKKQKPINDAIVKNYKVLEQKNNRLGEEKVRRMDKTQINIELIMDGNPSGPLYDEQQRQLATLGLRRHGYMVENGQTAIQIMLYKGKPEITKKQTESLLLLLPHIKEVEGGYKRVDIFDHNLSADGGWSLRIFEHGGVELVNRGKYVREKFDSLDAAMAYCEKHRWYEGGETYEEDY